MATIKTIRTLPEAAAYYTRSTDTAARSSFRSFHSKVDDMAANDIQLLNDLSMSTSLSAKVEFETLVLFQKHASSLGAEAKNAIQNGDLKKAGRLIGDISKLASLAHTVHEEKKKDARKCREIARVADISRKQIERLAEGMKDSISDIINKIKKEQEMKIKELQKAQHEAQKKLKEAA
ncbi:hypothetical protein ACFLZX_02965 [Nanoarchaeota archaeon]